MLTNEEKEKIERIYKTLPIGYYFGDNYDNYLDENCDCSYFDPTNQKIVVSTKQVEALIRTKKITNEEAIRGCLYHELSHVLLTPEKIFSTCGVSESQNIFEDERIERIAQGRFANVDFKKNCEILNDFPNCTKNANKSVRTYLFCLVRFGWDGGIPELLEITNSYLAFYSKPNCVFDQDFVSFPDLLMYFIYRSIEAKEEKINFIAKSYCDSFVKKQFVTKPFSTKEGVKTVMNKIRKFFCKENKNPSKDNSSQEKNKKSGNGSDEKATNSYQTEERKSSSTNSREKEANISGTLGKVEQNELFEEGKRKIQRMVKGATDVFLDKKIKKLLESYTAPGINSSSVPSYSGVLKPRNVCIRNDCKFFERKNETGNFSNKFADVNLIICCDRSGSFLRNEGVVNKLFASLSACEAKSKHFSWELITMDNKEQIMPKEHRVVFIKEGSCGNLLHKSISTQIESLKKRGAHNYVIVLFDGDCNPKYGELSSDILNELFDKKDYYLLIDQQNDCYIKKTKYQNYYKILKTHYGDELVAQVISVLEKIMIR